MPKAEVVEKALGPLKLVFLTNFAKSSWSERADFSSALLTMSGSQIPALLESVGRHKKFKALAAYNITCLTALITPPRSDWRT